MTITMPVKKADVQEYNGKPTINVKDCRDTVGVIMRATDTPYNEQTAQFLLEQYKDEFWGIVEAEAKIIFGNRVNVLSEGRSGKHLTVDGIYPLKFWNGADLSKWKRFVKVVQEAYKNATDNERLINDYKSLQEV